MHFHALQGTRKPMLTGSSNSGDAGKQRFISDCSQPLSATIEQPEIKKAAKAIEPRRPWTGDYSNVYRILKQACWEVGVLDMRLHKPRCSVPGKRAGQAHVQDATRLPYGLKYFSRNLSAAW